MHEFHLSKKANLLQLTFKVFFSRNLNQKELYRYICQNVLNKKLIKNLYRLQTNKKRRLQEKHTFIYLLNNNICCAMRAAFFFENINQQCLKLALCHLLKIFITYT